MEKLTPEQEALIPVYREKWKKLAFSTAPIDREKAAEAIKAAYVFIGKDEPEIVFEDSPNAAFNDISYGMATLGDSVIGELENKLINYQNDRLSAQISVLRIELGYAENALLSDLWDELIQFWDYVHYEIVKSIGEVYINHEEWFTNGCLFDFCFSVVNYCFPAEPEWEILQNILMTCGLTFPFERFCFVCDRPTKISIDNQGAESEEVKIICEFAY